MKKEKDSDLVLLNEYYTEAEALFDKGILKSNGIPCMISNELMSSIYPGTITSLGAIRLLVFKRDLDEAKKLLNL